MGVYTIKSAVSDNQAIVTDLGELLVKQIGGGGMNNVNIFDSEGNVLNSNAGSLDVNPVTGWTAFGQSTPNTVTVGTTSVEVLDANPLRRYASFANYTQQTVYLEYGIDAEWQSGYILRPNSIWIINIIELYLGKVNAIALTGTVDIKVVEGII